VELLLVRHALPERVELDAGRADPGLADAGRQQAALLAEYLEGESIDALYSSPLRRATETIEPLAARRGLPVTVIDGVAEWDRDVSSYVPIEELRRQRDARFADIT
jgi:probable phosphoglycerate mutase